MGLVSIWQLRYLIISFMKAVNVLPERLNFFDKDDTEIWKKVVNFTMFLYDILKISFFIDFFLSAHLLFRIFANLQGEC